MAHLKLSEEYTIKLPRSRDVECPRFLPIKKILIPQRLIKKSRAPRKILFSFNLSKLQLVIRRAISNILFQFSCLLDNNDYIIDI